MQKVGALLGGSVAGPAGAALGFAVGALIMGLGCILERTESNEQHARNVANYRNEISRQNYNLRHLNLIFDRLSAQESVQMQQIEQLKRIIEKINDEYDFYACENHSLRLQIREVEREIRFAERKIEKGESAQLNVDISPGFSMI